MGVFEESTSYNNAHVLPQGRMQRYLKIGVGQMEGGADGIGTETYQ